MNLDLQKFKKELTEEDIIKIMTILGADRYENRENYIIFPTICHNPIENENSMKLYYYKNSFMFHCYTECDENFDIYDLIKKVKQINGQNYNFNDIINFLIKVTDRRIIYEEENYEEKYKSVLNNYKQKNKIEISCYDKTVLQSFKFYPTYEWLSEDISIKAHKKFNILYSSIQNKIIIPHYDYKGNLIGIRGRALEEEDINTYGKYAPVRVENIIYKHPLSLNLYGIYENQENIRQLKTATIFEGEKSCLKYDDLYEYNISLASCGSNLNINQVQLLVKEFGVNNIILAYDKEFENFNSKKSDIYFNKLKGICEKYKNYCNFYFLFDFDNLLEEKDSPIDKGKEVFEKLLQNKVRIRNDL